MKLQNILAMSGGLSGPRESDNNFTLTIIVLVFSIIIVGLISALLVYAIKENKKEKEFEQKLKQNQGNKCITCGAEAGTEKLCESCRAKLEAEGIKIELHNKCALCGSDAGTDKICAECRKKLEDVDLTVEQKSETNPQPNIVVNNNIEQEPQQSSGCGSCCLAAAIGLGVVLIIFVIIIIAAGNAAMDFLKNIFNWK